jgi:hypothetical protein
MSGPDWKACAESTILPDWFNLVVEDISGRGRLTGRRYLYVGPLLDGGPASMGARRASVEALAALVNAALGHGKHFEPRAPDWIAIEPAAGSPAQHRRILDQD